MGDVVFEAGQRWTVKDGPVGVILTGRANSEYWADSAKNYWSEAYLHHLGVLDAPAPKPGQRWDSSVNYEVQIVDADGDLVAECWDNGDVLCRGTVVDVAKWLAQREYRCTVEPGVACVEAENSRGARGPHECGAVNATITNKREPNVTHMVASAVAEVFTAPSRDDSRRYVDMAVRALRGEPFAKAVQAVLISLVGDRISVFPSPNEIMATVDACHAWEYARGQVAPGKRTLNRAEAKELTEVAKVAAWARVCMRDASDISEIVAETYERARAMC